jgi:hypothetical protein
LYNGGVDKLFFSGSFTGFFFAPQFFCGICFFLFQGVAIVVTWIRILSREVPEFQPACFPNIRITKLWNSYQKEA